MPEGVVASAGLIGCAGSGVARTQRKWIVSLLGVAAAGRTFVAPRIGPSYPKALGFRDRVACTLKHGWTMTTQETNLHWVRSAGNETIESETLLSNARD